MTFVAMAIVIQTQFTKLDTAFFAWADIALPQPHITIIAYLATHLTNPVMRFDVAVIADGAAT